MRAGRYINGYASDMAGVDDLIPRSMECGFPPCCGGLPPADLRFMPAAFRERVLDAIDMLRHNEERRAIQEKHGGIVLRLAQIMITTNRL